MKRFLLLVLIFIIGSYSSSAQQYYIQINNLSLRVDGEQDVCQSWVKMTAEFYGNKSPKQFLYYDFGGGKGVKSMDDRVFLINGDLKSIYIQTYTNEEKDRWLGGDQCGGTEIYPEGRINNLNDICSTDHYNHFGRNGDDWEAENEIDFDYEIYPVIRLNRITDDNIGYTKQLNLSVTSNSKIYDPSVYNWKYHIEGEIDSIYIKSPFRPGYWRVFDVWRDMPTETMGKKSFDIIPKDFLEEDGFSPNEVINKKISFRINRCDGNTTNIITKVIRKAAPAIVSTHGYKSTCYGSGDASIRVYFDRQVDPGELISYVLYDKSIVAFTENGKDYYYPSRNSNNITEFTESGGKYFIDIANISSSEDYYFEIIGNDGNPSNDTGFDNKNGEVKDSGYKGAILYTGDGTYGTDIRIEPTPPVEFTINQENISCNGAADGKIYLSATGGLTGQFQFIIHDDAGNVVDGGWTDFSNGSTHTVSIKNKGKYSIKVMDSNGCKAIDYIKDPTTGELQVIGEKLVEVIIAEPEILTSTRNGNATDPKAFGFTDGAIYIKVAGAPR